MYKELEKYKTGKKVPFICELITDGSEVVIHHNEYIVGLGDLMNDFIEHKTTPFWERKYYHNHLTELYLKILNEVNIKINL
jgi:hypothetical protein